MKTTTFLETLEEHFSEMRFLTFIDHITAYYEAMEKESFLAIIDKKYVDNDLQRFIADLCTLLATSSPLSAKEFRFMLEIIDNHYGTPQRHEELKAAVQFISNYHKVPGKNYGLVAGI